MHGGSLGGDVPVENLAEDRRHRLVAKLVDGDRVEVTQESRRHLVTTTACGNKP